MKVKTKGTIQRGHWERIKWKVKNKENNVSNAEIRTNFYEHNTVKKFYIVGVN